MKPKTVGYIVTSKHGPLTLGTYDGIGKPLLMHGSHVTIFPTRAVAQAVIKRTRRYSERHGLLWEKWADWATRAVRPMDAP